MKVTWVIERHIFEEEQELALIAEVKKQNGEVKVIDPRELNYFDYRDIAYQLGNSPIVFRGSLNLSRKIQRETDWIPGVICNQKAFNCSTYYTYWEKWMLNKDYWMMPLSNLEYRTPFIQAYLATNSDYIDKVFIRPDSGMKQFTGEVYDLGSLKDIEPASFGRLVAEQPETLVLVAPVKQVDREYRFVVCDNKVVTGSQYFEKGEYVKQNTSLSNGVFIASCWLKSVLHDINWLPDQIYCVDVCESEEEFSILELNSFSCSALYSCDLSKVVEAANDVAISEWKETSK
jgi:hypothetical protein